MILINKHDLDPNGDSTIESPGEYINIVTGISYDYYEAGDGDQRCRNCHGIIAKKSPCYVMTSIVGHHLHAEDCTIVVHPDALITAYRKQYPEKVEKA